MNSTGNDIVALSSVDKIRTAEFRFFSKILCESEQAIYQQLPSGDLTFEYYIWLLWSVKEAAYKYLKRSIPDLVFTPVRIVIQNIKIPTADIHDKMVNGQWENTGTADEYYGGTVIYRDYRFYFRSKISGEWITSVVNDDEKFSNVYWGIKTIDTADYDHQSKAARSLVLQKLNLFFPGTLHIEKNEVGCPVILSGTRNMCIPVSLAHNGRFVSYSFILDSHRQSGFPKKEAALEAAPF